MRIDPFAINFYECFFTFSIEIIILCIREIFEIGRDCRYSNCLHTGEPGCVVYQAVVDGKIALSRYESYLSILDDTNEGKYR